MATSIHGAPLHRIVIVVFNILDWIFVLITATMIPCRELVIIGSGYRHWLFFVPYMRTYLHILFEKAALDVETLALVWTCHKT